MSQPANYNNFPLFLFIGGMRDGERLPVDPRVNQVELPLPGHRPKRKGAPVPTEIYRRVRLTGETEHFEMFVLKDVSGNSLVKALIENYPPASIETNRGQAPPA